MSDLRALRLTLEFIRYMTDNIVLTAINNMPHIKPGDDLAQLLLHAIDQMNMRLLEGDILAVAQKIVSKAEGRTVRLEDVQPGEEAVEIARQTGKDPRLVELILEESEEISRMRPGVLIVRHRLGFVCANAGIDRSNVAQEDGSETVLMLPEDPDLSAKKMREQLLALTGVSVGVVITDSHGRPFRLGTVGVAIGVAGFPALWDRRGEPDLYGYELQHTDTGLADEIAAAAGLVMGQAAEACPIVHFRGLHHQGTGAASDLVRPKEFDLYR